MDLGRSSRNHLRIKMCPGLSLCNGDLVDNLLLPSLPAKGWSVLEFQVPEPGIGEFIGDLERKVTDGLVLTSLAVHIERDAIGKFH
jgi:hypothetical protein